MRDAEARVGDFNPPWGGSVCVFHLMVAPDSAGGRVVLLLLCSGEERKEGAEGLNPRAGVNQLNQRDAMPRPNCKRAFLLIPSELVFPSFQ